MGEFEIKEIDDLEFFKKQKKRMYEAIDKLDPAKQTQKYVNLNGCATNMLGFISQLEGLIKAKQETAKREEENRKAAEEAMEEMAETKK